MTGIFVDGVPIVKSLAQDRPIRLLSSGRAAELSVGYNAYNARTVQVLDKIIHWYNEKRLHGVLGFLRPVDYYRGDPEEMYAIRRHELAQARSGPTGLLGLVLVAVRALKGSQLVPWSAGRQWMNWAMKDPDFKVQLFRFVEPRRCTENTMRHGFAPGLE